MVKISKEIKDLVDHQRLGFVATVSPDNTPNLSPKGTVIVWEDEFIVFGDIRSPNTIANIKKNPAVEINVIDHFKRRGYRFKGSALIIDSGEEYEKIQSLYKERGIKTKINDIVKVKVDLVSEVTAPSYDLGVTEEQLVEKWKKHYY